MLAGGGASAAAPREATAAFSALIASRYPGERGFRACSHVDYSPTEIDCWAETSKGTKRRMISATASPGSKVVFTKVASRSWIRRWTPVAQRLVHEFGASGTATANSPAYDWAFLLGAAADGFRRQTLPASYFAVDGNRSGMPAAMFRFRCTLAGVVVTCSNALGDELRYTPS
jgi:hypothetical protein